MRGIEVPPPEEDYTADPVELFFDLAFVFAFSRLVYLLVHEPNWTGVGEFALLMTLIWLPWSQLTWSANAVPGNNRKVRVTMLIGTVASIPMAASVTTALDDGGLTFAVPLAIILGLGFFTMAAGFGTDSTVLRSIITYMIPNAIAVALVIAGAFFDRDVRIAFWLAAIVIVVVGTIRAGRSEWLVRASHFAERHGLILIVALGEVIVAVGIPVVEALEEGEGFDNRTLTAMVASGTFACLLWWAYFDRVNPALEHRHKGHDETLERGRFARDVYTYSHLPIIAGVIMVAAALEEITLHPKDTLPVAFRWMLFAGLAAFFGGVAISVWRAFRVVARERLVGVAAMLVLTLVAGSMPGLTLLIVADILIFLVLVAEHRRVEGVRRADSQPTPATSSSGP